MADVSQYSWYSAAQVDALIAQKISGYTVDASATTKGIVQLNGDLSGTATNPTVPGLAQKANVSDLAPVARTGQYSDIQGKPTISGSNTGDQSLTVSGNQLSISAGNSVTLPVSSGTGVVNDASTNGKGIVRLAGDLAGSADNPSVPGLASKAGLDSPTFTGTPRVPLPNNGDNSTQIATTSFVKAQGYAANNSPGLTGTPTAPTAGVGTNSTQIATTAFVQAASSTTGIYNVLSYGAKGDGSTDDRVAIQNAIDAAGNAYNATGAMQEVYLPGRVFIVGVTPFYRPEGAQYGVCSLLLHSGVRLTGSGTIKCKAGSRGQGALYAVIRSDAAGIHNAGIFGITVDGNKGNNVSSSQCSNVLLNVAYDVTIQNISSIDADGEGIQILGPFNGGQSFKVKILHNNVINANRIGIQVSHFADLIIDGNSVSNCGNNCIDIYGDITGQQNGDGTDFIIANNICNTGLSGVFPETVANGIVSNNHCWNMRESGIHVNRSWSTVANVLMMGNTLYNCQFGILFTGDMTNVVARANYIWGVAQAGVKLGQEGYKASYISILDNVINTANLNSVPLVLFTGPQVAFCRVRGTVTLNTNRSYDNVFQNLQANVGNVVSPANAS